MSTAALLFAATFSVVLALGLQSLNVNGGHRWMAAITSFAIGTSNLVLFKVLPGPTDALQIAAYLLGGPVGIVCAMALHPRLVAWLRRKPTIYPPERYPHPPMPPAVHVPQPSDFRPRDRQALSMQLCQELVQDLLNPESLGHAVSTEVRQRAARALNP